MKGLSYLLGILFLSQWLVFFLLISEDPFYGDAISTISRAALHIYDSNFASIAYPEGFDPGHPVTIPALYAAVWKVFGISLPVSHLINFAFALGLLWLIFNRVKKEAGLTEAFIAVCTLSATPLFLAQSAMMNTHLPLSFFVFLAAQSLENDRPYVASLWMGCMMLIHLQAVFYWASLMLWFLWFRRKRGPGFWPLTALTLIPLCIFGLWVVYHRQLSGWAIVSPDYAAHRGMPSAGGILKNLLLADWRIADYGQIALLIPVLIFIFRYTRSGVIPNSISLFFSLYLVNALAIAFTTHTGPAHRYFLPCLPFLVLAGLESLRTLRPVWSLLALLILVSGHWWFYPGKILGDATLQYRQTFELAEAVCREVKGTTVYTFAPLGNTSRAMYLMENRSCFASLYDTSSARVDFILYGNVIGDFPDSLREKLFAGWPGNSWEGHFVHLTLFANPAEIGETPSYWKKRRPTKAEMFMEQMKQRLR